MLDNYLIVKMLMVGIIATLIILKTFLFLKTPGRKNLKSWFYYSVYQLVNAKSKKIETARKTQNVFTLAIIIAVIATCIVLFLFK